MNDLPDTTGAEALLQPRSIPSLPLDLPDTTDADTWLAPPRQPATDAGEAPQAGTVAPPADVAPAPEAPPQPVAEGAPAQPAPAPSAPAAPLSRRATDLTRRRPQVAGIINELAAAHGVDPTMLKVFAHIESDGDQNLITGSYKGVFQLSDAEFARHGKGGSIFDPKANTIAAIGALKEKSQAFQKTYGRLPSPTELYLMHQQGEGGLAAHLKNPSQPAWASMATTAEGRQKGAGWAKEAIWRNVPKDMRAQFGNDVDKITSAQFVALWAMKVQGIPYQQALSQAQYGMAGEGSIYGGPIAASGPVHPVLGTAPSFAPAGTPGAEVERAQIEAWEPSPTFYQTVEAAADETTFAYIFRDSPVFRPDPGYQPTLAELEERQQGLPEKYHDRLTGVSQGHSDFLTRQTHRQWDNERTLEEAGWTGTGISLVSSLLDPVDLAAAIASGGLGAAVGGAFKLGRIGQRVAAGVSAAAGNMALTGTKDGLGRATEGSEYAYAAALGMAFGFAFGPFARNPATQDIANAGAKAANEAVHAIEEGRLTGAGAAGDMGAAQNTSRSVVEFSADPIARMGADDAPQAAFGSARIDMAGRGGSSDSPSFRALAQMLGFDAVGAVGKDGQRVAQGEAVGEAFQRLRGTFTDRLASALLPQFEEWGKANGYVHFWNRTVGVGKAWGEFGNEVTRWVRDTAPGRDERYAPQVVKVGKVWLEIQDQMRLLQINPRRDLPDNPGRPLAGGFEGVPRNDHRIRRKWQAGKIIADGGRAFRDWLDGALLSNHPELGDKSGVIAEGMFKNIIGRAFHIDEFMMMARDGTTADVLRDAMKGLGIGDDDIEEILARLPKGSKQGFAHHRLDINENFVLNGKWRLEDFTEANGIDLILGDIDQQSRWIALGQGQIVNEKGAVLLNGIRSVQEFESVLRAAKDNAFAFGLQPQEIADAEALAREMFDRIRGVPHEKAGSTIDQMLELGRNMAMMVLGGSLGVAALGDLGKYPSLGGLRAMLQHMPALRTGIVEGGVLRPRSQLTRDFQAVGAWDSQFRVLSTGWSKELDLETPLQGTLGRLLGASRVGADAVVRLSGLPAINRQLREKGAAIMAQRFYDDAMRAMTSAGIDLSRLRPAELGRMTWFGLDEPMLKRVLEQFRRHATAAPGVLGEAVTSFNPAAWDDPEALHAFVTAVRRGAGRIVMEQDPIGSGILFDRSPVFRTLMQLRRFALNAWHQNILHGLHMRDGEAFWDVAYTAATAAMLYALRTRMQAATQSDPERFLEERFAPGAFAAAVFQLSSYSSLAPMLVDTFGARLLGANPIFAYSTSGKPSDALFGNPTIGTIDALINAPGALIRPMVQGRERSQQEWRQMLAILPFQNNFAVQMAFGRMIMDAPRLRKQDAGYDLSDAIMGNLD